MSSYFTLFIVFINLKFIVGATVVSEIQRALFPGAPLRVGVVRTPF